MPLYDVSMQGSLVGAARHEHGIADCLSRAPLFLGSVALFFHVQEGLLLLVLGLPQHRANHNFNHLWVSGAANWGVPKGHNRTAQERWPTAVLTASNTQLAAPDTHKWLKL